MLSADAQGIIHTGVLKKSPPEDQMKKRRSWRDRYFQLYRRANGAIHLYYYRTADKLKHADNYPKGVIDMATCLAVESGHTLKGFEKLFSFTIVTPRRTYFLLSKKQADMQLWVDKICKVCGFEATKSISPATLRGQLRFGEAAASSHGNLSTDAGGEYNDAFADTSAAVDRRGEQGVASNFHHQKSVPNHYAAEVDGGRILNSVNHDNRFRHMTSPFSYESLEDYGHERGISYNSATTNEYFDNTLANQTYGPIVGAAPAVNHTDSSFDDIYGGGADSVQLYGSAMDNYGQIRCEYGPSGDYGYGAVEDSLIANSTASNNCQSKFHVPPLSSTTHHDSNAAKGRQSEEHYLNLLPDRSSIETSLHDGGGQRGKNVQANAAAAASNQKPPPIDRTIKPQNATKNSRSNSEAATFSTTSSATGNGRKVPPNLNFHGPTFSHHRPNLNDVYSQVPLSPVTSFSKKRGELPSQFFTNHQMAAYNHGGLPSLNETNNPPSPSRESINSSNSASDPETVAAAATNGNAPSTTGSGSSSRVSTSLPASAAVAKTTSMFDEFSLEIKYTELAPDSPAYFNIPNGGPGVVPNASSSSQSNHQAGKYSNINTFDFSFSPNRGGSAAATDKRPEQGLSNQRQSSLDHGPYGSSSNASLNNSSSDSKLRGAASYGGGLSMQHTNEIEYTQIDLVTTNVLNQIKKEREEERAREAHAPFKLSQSVASSSSSLSKH